MQYLVKYMSVVLHVCFVNSPLHLLLSLTYLILKTFFRFELLVDCFRQGRRRGENWLTKTTRFSLLPYAGGAGLSRIYLVSSGRSNLTNYYLSQLCTVQVLAPSSIKLQQALHYLQFDLLFPDYGQATRVLTTTWARWCWHQAELNTTSCKLSSTTGTMSMRIIIWRNCTGWYFHTLLKNQCRTHHRCSSRLSWQWNKIVKDTESAVRSVTFDVWCDERHFFRQSLKMQQATSCKYAVCFQVNLRFVLFFCSFNIYPIYTYNLKDDHNLPYSIYLKLISLTFSSVSERRIEYQNLSRCWNAAYP